MTSDDTPNALLTIFTIVKKADLVSHCRTAVITRTDLANLIFACQAKAIPIGHVPFFKHHHPEHLHPTDKDFAAITDNPPGKLSKDARKFTSKIGQMFQERRMFNGHLFIPLEWAGHWHFFYFDQRDADAYTNHWEHGSHLHLINMVTHPRLPVEELAKKLDAETRPNVKGSLHIRFQRSD